MKPLYASIVGPEHQIALSRVSKLPPFQSERPLNLSDGHDSIEVNNHWAEELSKTSVSSLAFWSNQRKQIAYHPRSELVGFGLPDGFNELEEALQIIEPLPFELAVLGSVFFDEWIEADYDRWGVGRSAIDHGLACIFRGAGHDRLASRRWLDFGPWRVIRRPNDTTVIQFHDLGLTDPAAAYEQAKLGHQLLGNSPLSGHINYHYAHVLQHAKAGLYVEETKTRHVVIPPRGELSPGDLLCETALRLHHRLTPGLPQPIETIAYTFFNPEEAEPHLHQLWLREIECWVIGRDDGKRHRLDLDYHPVPDPPDWVKRLEAR